MQPSFKSVLVQALLVGTALAGGQAPNPSVTAPPSSSSSIASSTSSTSSKASSTSSSTSSTSSSTSSSSSSTSSKTSSTSSSASSTPTSAAIAAGKGWSTTLFLDDFTGAAGSQPSTNNWIYQTGTSYPGGPPQWGTWEVESYTNSTQNVRLDGSGNLLIVPLKDATAPGGWTSARIETKLSSYTAPAGGKMKIEASLRLPATTTDNGAGYWPAFWTVGGGLRANYSNWPAIGEFDIMENVNSLANVNTGLHCGINPGGPCNEPNGIGSSNACTSTSCRAGFHTYAVVLDRSVSPETLTYSIDGAVRQTITQTQVGASVWAQGVTNGVYVILNVAIGGSFPNALYGSQTPTANTTSGLPMAVDYVGVWTNKS